MRKKSQGITKSEEYELLRRAKAGDNPAKAALIEAHTPFIANIIKKEFTLASSVSEEDLMQEGRIGLLDAIDRFEMERDLRFLTFAYWRIKKALVAYLSEMAYQMKVPFADVVKLRKVTNRLDMGLSESPNEDAEFINQQKNVHILALLMGCLPINPTEYIQNTEDSYWSVHDSKLLERASQDPTDPIISGIMVDEIISQLSKLPAAEGFMLGQALGLYVAETPIPLKYIAGERSRITTSEDGEVEVIPGWNGYGLQIGETYNSVGKRIKESEAKFKHYLRDLLGPLYADYLEN